MARDDRRARQLRLAKRAQRARDRAAGRDLVQLKLPAETAEKLRVAMKEPAFLEQLDAALDGMVVAFRDYPVLQELAWNLSLEHLPARQAFAIYERNWRFVDAARMTQRERELVTRLADRFGGGVIHA